MAKSSSKKSMPSRINVTVDKDSSVTVRQIENGYLVSEGGTRGKGKNKEWYNREYFSKTNPVKIAGAAPKFGGRKNG